MKANVRLEVVADLDGCGKDKAEAALAALAQAAVAYAQARVCTPEEDACRVELNRRAVDLGSVVRSQRRR